jgi:hypothetical protein
MKLRIDDRPQIQIRLEPALLDRLRAAADERCVSTNLVVVHAITEYLDRLIPVDELLITRETEGQP